MTKLFSHERWPAWSSGPGWIQLMTKPPQEAGVTLKVSHAELNLNKLTKEESNERGNCMKNHLQRHCRKMQLTGTNAGPHYLTSEVFSEWSQLWGLLMDFCSLSKVLFIALPLIDQNAQWLLNWQKKLTLSWCLLFWVVLVWSGLVLVWSGLVMCRHF